MEVLFVELVLFRKFKDLTKKQKVLCVFQSCGVGIVLGVVIAVLISKSYAVQNIMCIVEYKLNPSADNLYYLCENLRNSNSNEYEKYYNELLGMEDLQIEKYQANPTTENLFYLCDFLLNINSKRSAQFCHTLVNRKDFDDYSNCSKVYDELNATGDETSAELLTLRNYYLLSGLHVCIYWKDVDGLVQEIKFINQSDDKLVSVVPYIYQASDSCDNGFFTESSVDIVNLLCKSIFKQIETDNNFFNNQLCKDELLFVLSYYENRDNQGLEYSKTELEYVYSEFLKEYYDMYDDEHLQEAINKDKEKIYDYHWYWSGLLGAWK